MKIKNIHFIKDRIYILLVAVTFVILGSCQNDQTSGKSIEEIQADGKISSIIRSPITAEGIKDSINVAKMEFEELTYDFGEVNEGEIVEHTFQFTNTGKIPLIINDAHSTCGCTVPKWPKDPVAPGAKGNIHVEFNTKSKPNHQEKPVIINANTYPSVTNVYIKGFVRPKERLDASKESTD
ncbi:MAG: DUF1573 domain-containing protein [Saprospiraceae bacterium]